MLRFLIQVRNVVHVSIRKIKVFNHEHDTVHYAKCPDESCLRYYVGESSRRVSGRVKDNGRNNSPIFLNVTQRLIISLFPVVI